MTINPVLPLYVLYILLALIAGAIVCCIFKKNLRHAKNIRRLAIIALILVAMLRPGISNGSAERDLSNLNIFFIVDNTGSMAAKDMNDMSEYRYKVAAEDMKSIIKLFPGSKYAIISLDYNAYQAMPLIDDTDTALAYVNSLSPKESHTSADSDLSSLLRLAGERIEKYNERYSDRNSLLFFFSDGETSGNSEIAAPATLSQDIVGGAVIGYGTTNGARIGEISFNSGDYSYSISESRFVKDNITRTEHISKLNETELNKVASQLGIKYYRRSSSGDKFNDINNFTSESAIYHHSNDKASADSDLYWLFIFVALVLLLWDFYTILESVLLERKVAK